MKIYPHLSAERLANVYLVVDDEGTGLIVDPAHIDKEIIEHVESCCRNLAAARNLDNTRWDDILKVIPSMREDATLQETSLKFGKFNGTETMNYVENILNIYSAFCEICPA